jgi:diguanylate cyclase (GGDEF)-like protein
MSKTQKYLEHIHKLLRDKKIPELKYKLAKDHTLVQIHRELKAIRETMFAFSVGDFSPSIDMRGFIPGCLKTLQANLRHLIWQVQMVEKGDMTQEVHFMGEFSVAFNNMARKLKCIKFQANHDSLTGVYNRRPFIELAEIKLANAAEMSIQCCLALLDIDHFKKFNDTYGHPAGDEALRHVVKTIESGLRKDDFMGRYGGEEFILFFYNTNEETGLKIVERIREKLSENPVILKKGPVTVQASFGLVGSCLESSKEKDYIQKLINDADKALYAAKVAGRNRSVLFGSQ